MFEKTGEMLSYVFGLVAQKCQGQVKVLRRDDTSLYLFLHADDPVDGMTVRYQCDKKSSRCGLRTGCGLA